MAHRTYRLRDLLAKMGACPSGVSYVKQFETAAEIEESVLSRPWCSYLEWFVREADRRLAALGLPRDYPTDSSLCRCGCGVSWTVPDFEHPDLGSTAGLLIVAKKQWLALADHWGLYTEEP